MEKKLFSFSASKLSIAYSFLIFLTLATSLLLLSYYGIETYVGKLAFALILLSFFISLNKCLKEQTKMKSIVEFYELSQYIDDLRLLQQEKPFEPILKAVTGLGKYDWAVLFLINNKTKKFEVADAAGISINKFQNIAFSEIADNNDNDAVLTLKLLKKVFKTETIEEAVAGSAIYYNSIYFGCLLVGRHAPRQEMSESDHFRLKVLSDQISICFHNNRMHNELKQKADQLYERQQQVQRELKLAKIVQDGVIYKKTDKFDGIGVKSFLKPARFIGGDFLKFVELPHEKLVGILIGDVSGKGIPAALVMAVVVSMFLDRREKMSSPGEIMTEINIALKEFLGAGSRFNSTAFFGTFNLEKKELCYASAGHDFPLHFSNKTKKVSQLLSTGTMLGLFKESKYETKKIKLNNGDKLFFYTDGLTDFMEYEKNAEDGFEYLNDFFKSKVKNIEIVTELRDMIENSKTSLKDDITVAEVSIN